MTSYATALLFTGLPMSLQSALKKRVRGLCPGPLAPPSVYGALSYPVLHGGDLSSWRYPMALRALRVQGRRWADGTTRYASKASKLGNGGGGLPARAARTQAGAGTASLPAGGVSCCASDVAARHRCQIVGQFVHHRLAGRDFLVDDVVV